MSGVTTAPRQPQSLAPSANHLSRLLIGRKLAPYRERGWAIPISTSNVNQTSSVGAAGYRPDP